MNRINVLYYFAEGSEKIVFRVVRGSFNFISCDRRKREAIQNIYYKFLFLIFSLRFRFAAILGVNITLIFFGWLLVISSFLLAYATFKRQSRLCVPYMFALFETVLLVILLEALPEFIDNLGVGWFLLINFLIGKC